MYFFILMDCLCLVAFQFLSFSGVMIDRVEVAVGIENKFYLSAMFRFWVNTSR